MCTRFKRSQVDCLRAIGKKGIITVFLNLFFISLAYSQFDSSNVVMINTYYPAVISGSVAELQSKSIVQLSNTMNYGVNGYCHISVEGTGWSISSDLTNQSLMILGAYSNEVFAGETCGDILNFKNVKVQGIANDFYYSGLPEDDHVTICIQFMSATNQPLSALDCKSFVIGYQTAPEILTCNSTINLGTPDNKFTIAWTPSMIYGTIYSVMMKPVVQGVDLTILMTSNQFPATYMKIVSTPFVQVSWSELHIAPGDSIIGVIIQAHDLNDQVIFQNDGWSVPCSFTIGSQNLVSGLTGTTLEWGMPSAFIIQVGTILHIENTVDDEEEAKHAKVKIEPNGSNGTVAIKDGKGLPECTYIEVIGWDQSTATVTGYKINENCICNLKAAIDSKSFCKKITDKSGKSSWECTILPTTIPSLCPGCSDECNVRAMKIHWREIIEDEFTDFDTYELYEETIVTTTGTGTLGLSIDYNCGSTSNKDCNCEGKTEEIIIDVIDGKIEVR